MRLSGRRGERILAAAVLARHVRPSSRFAVLELLHRQDHRLYALKGSGVSVAFRHRSADLATFDEVFGRAIYDPPPLAKQALDAVPGGPDVLDLGANVGMFGAYALARLGAASVLSYEPDRLNLGALRAAVASSGAGDRWQVVEGCAATRDGTLHFASRGTPDARTTDDTTAEVSPAYDVLPQIAAADFVKIDIEGGEWEILRDERLKGTGRTVLVMEHHAHGALTPDAGAEARALLQAAGFEVIDSKSGSDEDLLWALRLA